MKNLYIKPPRQYSQQEKVAIYSLAALVIVSLIGFSLWKDNEYNRSILEGKKFKVRILSVSCTSGKSPSGLFFLDRNKKVNKVNVNNVECHKYKQGDTVTVFHNEKQDWYYMTN